MGSAEETPGLDVLPVEPFRFGLQSLAEMINCQVWGLCQVLRHLKAYEEMIVNPPPAPADESGNISSLAPVLGATASYQTISEAEKKNIRDMFTVTESAAKNLELDSAIDRINIFTGKSRWVMSRPDAVGEIRALREAIESQIVYRYFYH
jgi:hypothetical protein